MEIVENSLQKTGFTEMHFDVASNFIKRVKDILNREIKTPKTYGLDSEKWQDRESLKIEIDEHTTLSLDLITRK